MAEISRITRNDQGLLIGYQRPEVRRHINDITDYLNSQDVIFPNSIILALSTAVRFRSSRGPGATDGYATAGTILIPLPQEGGVKPGWIVDGQQRTLALCQSEAKKLPVPVSAFVADEISTQREQFLRINNTQPLPRGLVTELLPEIGSPLPLRLAVQKIPSELCDLLNTSPDSPFRGLIRRPSTARGTVAAHVVSDTSVVRMLRESLNSTSGCLFPYRNVTTGEVDSESMWRLLVTYWSAVRDVFPKAWGRPPAESRLMHSAGLTAMGRLMDRVLAAYDPHDSDIVGDVRRDLELIAPRCAWTEGRWDGLDGLRWNELQNVPRHVRMLSSYLIRVYVERKRGG